MVDQDLSRATFYCNLHDRYDCTLCDECGHESIRHTNLHDVADPDWSKATCWSESICTDCADADLDRGTGPDRYPSILRDANGRAVDVG